MTIAEQLRQLESRLESLSGRVDDHLRIAKTQSLRIGLAEQANDRQDDTLTDLASRIADLEQRAVFVQHSNAITATVILRIPAEHVRAVVAAAMGAFDGPFAAEVLV